MSDTYSFINDQGLVETVDLYSGKTIAIQSSKEDLLKSKQERMTQVLTPTGDLVFIERGVSLDSFHQKPRWTYSEILIDLICGKLLEGKRLTKICEEPGMPPYQVLAKWRRQFPECNDRILQARSDYAEILREEVLEQAFEQPYRRDHEGNLELDKNGEPIPQTPSSEYINQRKMRVEALKWAASVDNPERYGARTKVVGDANAPLQLIVDTGIRRAEDIKEAQKTNSGELTDGTHQTETHVALPSASSDGGGNTPAVDGDGDESTSGSARSPVE